MSDIRQYGDARYGPLTSERVSHRNEPSENAFHSAEHFQEYLYDIPHDHFGTLRHQLAAVAVNALIEYIQAGLEDEP